MKGMFKCIDIFQDVYDFYKISAGIIDECSSAVS